MGLFREFMRATGRRRRRAVTERREEIEKRVLRKGGPAERDVFMVYAREVSMRSVTFVFRIVLPVRSTPIKRTGGSPGALRRQSHSYS